MTTISADMFPGTPQLTDDEIASVLASPSGSFGLMCLCRDGRIDAERCVEAIEANRIRHTSSWERLGLATLDTLFSR